ncbi:MAG TPA: hypothetical protein VGC86_00205 [Afipia sp.]
MAGSINPDGVNQRANETISRAPSIGGDMTFLMLPRVFQFLMEASRIIAGLDPAIHPLNEIHF